MADNIIFYEHPLSPYAQKCKIAMREKNIPFEARLPDAIGTGNAGGEFVDASPRMEVPAFLHNGLKIFDSTIILEYIEDTWPDPALRPETPAARARARMIEDMMDTHYEAITWALGEIHFFQRAQGSEAEKLTATAGAQLAQAHKWLEAELGDADWFGGHQFGWADLSVVPYVNGAIGFGFAPEDKSPLGKWLARANERASVAQTRDEANASVGNMDQLGEAIASGAFKRQYRDHRLEWMMRSGGAGIVEKGMKAGNIRFVWPFA